MKILILLAAVSIAVVALSPAYAGKITMSNPTSEELSNGRTLCIYEDAIHSFQYITKGRCPYSKTFDTEGTN